VHFEAARTNEIPCPSSFFHQGNIRCDNLSRKQSRFRKKPRFRAQLNVLDRMEAVTTNLLGQVQGLISPEVATGTICPCCRSSIVVEGEPKGVCVCICLACQKNSGSAFGVSTYWPKSAVVQTSG
jgi:hypothetical protein